METAVQVQIPEFSMIMMVGPSGSGKSTLARRIFAPTEVLSSDFFRGMIADDPNDQAASREAFSLLHEALAARLRNRRLTVVDATNLEGEHRRRMLDIARENDAHVMAVVMDIPREVCAERNEAPGGRGIPEGRLRHQHGLLRRCRRGLRKEGFRQIVTVKTADDADQLEIGRVKSRADRRELTGPFDIIGDVHGCHRELQELLEKLGYDVGTGTTYRHPEGRTAVFLGDLVDRGPDNDGVLMTVMAMVEEGSALCVEGNHENKLSRKLQGRNVQVSHGLAETLEQLERNLPEFQSETAEFLRGLESHYLLDGGKLCVVHAGMKERYLLRNSRRVRDFCLYGETNGETDEWGLPVRLDWAQEYRGDALVVYGHTPTAETNFVNNTVCIDTGCVFGGRLTALRYPERELMSVDAHRTYYESVKPLTAAAGGEKAAATGAAGGHDIPSLRETTLGREVVLRSGQKIRLDQRQLESALEPMSRFALDPRWLIYMPPTISPAQASGRAGLLEHPEEAFRQYREDGVAEVICEEKHMGSRGLIVLGQDGGTLRERFGFTEGMHDGLNGACYSRTGRKFFREGKMEADFMEEARRAVTSAGLWDELETDWLLLDCEIMPWSLKATGLLRQTYAPTAAAAVATLGRSAELLERAQAKGIETRGVRERTLERLNAALRYREAYRQYCWEAESIEDVRVAPFHVLAGEGRTFFDQTHEWHMGIADRLAQASSGIFQRTERVSVRLNDPDQEAAATMWWEKMTARGGEGMVVKPMDFIPRGEREQIQPAVKVRGPLYLSIIYGPEYGMEGNLERMRRRGLGTKRRMALQESALAQEGLERFVSRESLHRVHECAYAVMALETQPVDPRL